MSAMPLLFARPIHAPKCGAIGRDRAPADRGLVGRRMRFFAVLAVLILAGCGPTGTGPDATCTREVNNDPEVQRLLMIASASSYGTLQLDEEMQNAKARARNQCLRRLGVMEQGGGVQPISRSRSLFDGFR